MKKLLFTFVLALLATASAWAQTFTAGNLKYEVTDAAAKTVKLTGYVTKPTGALTIPATVTNGGTTYSVTAIGIKAFYECDGITSVTIPDGVIGIGQSAFNFCKALTTVTIPDGVTSIGGYAFSSCLALSSVTIPESVTNIGRYAFNSCSFTEVNIPGNITVIEEGVFRNCGKLTKISIPGKVTAIGQFAFKDCYALKEVTIGKEVKEIGANAFVNCFKLAKMTVQAIEPPIVGADAFFNVERDIPVYVREGRSHFYSAAATWKEFKNLQIWEQPTFTVDNLKYGIPEPGDESVEIIGYETRPEGRLAIPETVAYEGKSYNVTMIGYGAFKDCSALTQVIIPDKITRILNNAFFACYNLGKMAVLAKVPPKVDDGTRTFYGVKREIPVYVPAESLEAYKAADVWSWFNVVPYELPEFTVDGLKYKATSISTVTLVGYETEPTGKLDIPATVSYEGSEYSVTEIGDEAFAYCENLTELVVPPTVTIIGQHAFHYNRQFTKIVVHATTPPLMRQDAFANTELSTPVYVPAESLEAYKAANRWKEFTNLQAIVVDNFTVDGLKYRIIDEKKNRVEVTGYEGYVPEKIPATVSYGGKDYSVTRIGNKAFTECFWVSSFTLPDGLTSIGEEAFSYCWELVEFTIPNSVETIEKAAFAYNFMQKITIGSGVKSIADEAFADNDSFAEMTVLAVVPPTVGTDAFRGTKRDIPVHVPAASLAAYKVANVWKEFTNLQAMDLLDKDLIVNGLKYKVTDEDKKTVELIGYETKPEGALTIPATVTNGGKTYNVTSIGNKAFYLCNGITEVTIPDGVITIGYYAFSFCTALTKVTIPNSVTTIVHHAFENCKALTEIIFGNGLTTIQELAFYYCSSLQQVTIPASVTSIGLGVFGNCHALTQINVESANTAYCSENGVLFSHDKTRLVQYPAGKPETSYIIPEDVATITDGAFESCNKLMTVSIPSSMTTIKQRAFLYCSSLTEMTVLATTPPTVGDVNAFSKVSRDIPVYVPAASLAAYKVANVWKEFTNLQAMDLLDKDLIVNGLKYKVTDEDKKTVELIGYETAPTGALTIPATVTYAGTEYKVTSIGAEAFYDCSFTSVTIPDGVTIIKYSAFQNCTELTEVTFGNSITTIEDAAFYSCTSLKQVTIPKSVTNIGMNVFFYCTDMTHINVDTANTAYSSENGVLFNKDKTTLLRYPAAKPETTYIVPKSVTCIGQNAFGQCTALKELTLSENVSRIESYAFEDFAAITKMTVLAIVPPTAETSAFVYFNLDTPVHVPAESLAAYQAADGWKEFTNLQAIAGTAIDTPSMPESISIQGGMLHNPQGLTISIYDLTGRLVYSGNATTVELPAGIYVVSCSGASCKAVF